MTDIYKKVIESTRIGADCECCWKYDLRALDLECGHQESDYKEFKVWEICRCGECSWDYDE